MAVTLQRHSKITSEISFTPVAADAPARRFAAKMRGRSITAPTMIRLGSQIRLTRLEVERFSKITDIVPVGICTFDDLEAYIACCKAHYWGVSKETRFLHWLIDREVDRCLLAA